MKQEKQQSEIVKRALAVIRESQPFAQQAAAEPIEEGRLVAVEICSNVLEAHIWLVLDDNFVPPADGQAVFYADELEFLKTKNVQTLREIHKVKLAFGGGRVRQ
jgi:hypothetical protein